MRQWKMHSGAEICYSSLALLVSLVTNGRPPELALDLRHTLSVIKGKAEDDHIVKSSMLSRETLYQHRAP